jgi:anti-sigma B factor antagonist
MAGLDPTPDLGPELAIETRPGTGGVPVVSVSGELDSANAGTLADALTPLFSGSPERIVFELSGLRFMDSAGIAVLINAKHAVATVELRNPSAIVRRVIEATGLTAVFELVP